VRNPSARSRRRAALALHELRPWESFETQREWKESDEFRERMTRVRRHVDDFTPSTYELVTQVD
jgi:heme-degrading monooxygenase HmoA